jgi:hypothetical protein
MPSKQKSAKNNRVSSDKDKATGPPIVPSKPNWPAIKHCGVDDLSLAKVFNNQIYTISNLWPASLCKAYISFLQTLPLTTTPGKPKKGEAVRVNDRFQVDDADFAERLWRLTALKQTIENPTVDGQQLTKEERNTLWGGQVLGLNSNIRIYRYTKGQFFDQHCKYFEIPNSIRAAFGWPLI